MVILDTSIFIYVGNGTLDVETLRGNQIGFASATKIEALGFSRITAAELAFLEQLFAECQQFDLDEGVIKLAIQLRQQNRMSLADVIIAATAIEHDCDLWTANEADFADVEGLTLRNPLQASLQ